MVLDMFEFARESIKSVLRTNRQKKAEENEVKTDSETKTEVIEKTDAEAETSALV